MAERILLSLFGQNILIKLLKIHLDNQTTIVKVLRTSLKSMHFTQGDTERINKAGSLFTLHGFVSKHV